MLEGPEMKEDFKELIEGTLKLKEIEGANMLFDYKI